MERIKHHSGANPVPGEAVTVWFRGGGSNNGESVVFLGWVHADAESALSNDDIVEYHVHPRRNRRRGSYSTNLRSKKVSGVTKP